MMRYEVYDLRDGRALFYLRGIFGRAYRRLLMAAPWFMPHTDVAEIGGVKWI